MGKPLPRGKIAALQQKSDSVVFQEEMEDPY